ncbi:hypothetical protein ACPA9J_03845 [Pseudomonas aeruginosa]
MSARGKPQLRAAEVLQGKTAQMNVVGTGCWPGPTATSASCRRGPPASSNERVYARVMGDVIAAGTAG